jgi:hypothetical protein
MIFWYHILIGYLEFGFHFWNLRNVKTEFEKLTKQSLEKAIKSEFRGDAEKLLLTVFEIYSCSCSQGVSEAPYISIFNNKLHYSVKLATLQISSFFGNLARRELNYETRARCNWQ